MLTILFNQPGGGSAPVNVTPDTATLTLTTFAPTVTATANVFLTPAPATLTLTSYAPTVSNGVQVQPTPSSGPGWIIGRRKRRPLPRLPYPAEEQSHKHHEEGYGGVEVGGFAEVVFRPSPDRRPVVTYPARGVSALALEEDEIIMMLMASGRL